MTIACGKSLNKESLFFVEVFMLMMFFLFAADHLTNPKTLKKAGATVAVTAVAIDTIINKDRCVAIGREQAPSSCKMKQFLLGYWEINKERLGCRKDNFLKAEQLLSEGKTVEEVEAELKRIGLQLTKTQISEMKDIMAQIS